MDSTLAITDTWDERSGIMGESIQQLCFNVQLRGNAEHQVTDFAKAQGDEPTSEILYKIAKQRGHEQKNGMRLSSSLTLWNELSKQYVKSVGARQRTQAAKDEEARHRHEYEATLERGYEPTNGVLKKQLTAMYGAGEITPEQFEWGMSGAELVRDLAAVANVITEDEKAIIAGYDDRLEV